MVLRGARWIVEYVAGRRVYLCHKNDGRESVEGRKKRWRRRRIKSLVQDLVTDGGLFWLEKRRSGSGERGSVLVRSLFLGDRVCCHCSQRTG